MRAAPSADIQYPARRFTTYVKTPKADKGDEYQHYYTKVRSDYADAQRWGKRKDRPDSPRIGNDVGTPETQAGAS